jgi:Flp pilus assembly protein TadD
MSSKSRQRGGPRIDRRKQSFPGPNVTQTRPRTWKLIALVGLCLVIGVSLGVWSWNHLRKHSENPGLSSASLGTTRAVASGSAARPNRSNQTDDAFAARVNRGTKLLAQNKPAEAVQVLTEAMQMKPGDEDVHYDLGMALARLGKTDEAIQQYEEALKLLPDYVEVHNNLGNLLMRSGRLNEATQHFQTAIKIMPEYASAHNNLGTALQHLGQNSEALDHFERAAKLNPDYWEAHFNVANAYVQAGRINEARSELQTVLRLQPGFEPAQAALTQLQKNSTGQ